MPGDKFARITEGQDPEQLADFMQYRYDLLTKEQGHICTRASQLSYDPFYNTNTYPHVKHLGNLSGEVWKKLKSMTPAGLIHPNPFELSAIRVNKDGSKAYRCWDTAVAVPACDMRGAVIYGQTAVPGVRTINTHWIDTMRRALSYVGPLGPNGKILRPHGPFTLDLTQMGDFGWTLREAAHVLAHLRADHVPPSHLGKARNKLAYLNNNALAELAYGILYDLPVDVSPTRVKGDPDTYYGVDIQSSTQLDSPVLRVPWEKRAMHPDRVLACMLTAVLTEPIPNNIISGGVGHDKQDKWSGGPSLVAMVGWEGIDFITHLPVGRYVQKEYSPMDYVVRGAALLTPEDHWKYLALGRSDRAPPDTSAGSRWQYVTDWLQSEEYLELRAATPALPCKDCYLINGDTQGAPKKPRSQHPEGPASRWPKAWQEYYAEVDRCITLTEASLRDYEPLYFDATSYPRLDPKKRRAANNKRKKALKDEFADAELLATAIKKVNGELDTPLTERQYERYDRYEKERLSGKTKDAE